jgi:hypothetical protein
LPGAFRFSGSSIGVVATAPGGKFYSTTFPADENPVSEGGVWYMDAGSQWYAMNTSGGVLYSGQTFFGGYHDSFGYLKNYGFGSYQRVKATVKIDVSTWSDAHDIELLLKFAASSGSARGYEVLIGHNGGSYYTGIVRWNGPYGDFTILTLTYGTITIADGDVFEASITPAGLITARLNGTQITSYTDTTFTDGEPGAGFFSNQSGTNSTFGYYDWEATDGIINVSVSAGTVRYSGNVPTVTTRADVALAAGSLAFAGSVVSVVAVSAGTEVSVSPEAGALRFTGLAPTIATRADIAPINGAMLFTGQLPDVRTLVNVSPLGGTMNLTGQVVGAIGGSIVTVSALAGETRFSGAAMTVQVLATYAVTPSTGAVQFAGQVPTVTLKIPFGWVKSGRNARTWTKTSSSGAWVQR